MFSDTDALKIIADRKSNGDYTFVRSNRIKFNDQYYNYKDGKFTLGKPPRVRKFSENTVVPETNLFEKFSETIADKIMKSINKTANVETKVETKVETIEKPNPVKEESVIEKEEPDREMMDENKLAKLFMEQLIMEAQKI